MTARAIKDNVDGRKLLPCKLERATVRRGFPSREVLPGSRRNTPDECRALRDSMPSERWEVCEA